MKETRIGFITLALMLAIWASACGNACGGLGSCIEIGEEPEPPTCTELVTDECVEEVIEEFCPPPRVIVVPPRGCEPEVLVDVYRTDCEFFADRPAGHRPKECRP